MDLCEQNLITSFHHGKLQYNISTCIFSQLGQNFIIKDWHWRKSKLQYLAMDYVLKVWTLDILHSSLYSSIFQDWIWIFTGHFCFHVPSFPEIYWSSMYSTLHDIDETSSNIYLIIPSSVLVQQYGIHLRGADPSTNMEPHGRWPGPVFCL